MGKYLPLAISAMPALLLFLTWSQLDTMGVYGGGADGLRYVTTAKKVLSEVEKSSSISEALRAVYETRVWKGFIIPQLFTPFLALTDMNSSLAIFLFEGFFLCVFLVYLFFLFEMFLSPWSAAFATMMVSTIPWLFSLSLVFDSYLPFIACSLMAAYHLVRSKHLASTTDSLLFGFASALAACIRPVDFVLNFGVPLIFYFLYFVFSKDHWRKHLAAFCLPLIATILIARALSLAEFMFPDSLWPLAVLIPIQLVPLIFYKKLELPRNFALGYSSILSLVSLWWLPFSRDLMLWSRTASVGEISKEFPRSADFGVVDFVIDNYLMFGGLGFFLLLVGLFIHTKKKIAVKDVSFLSTAAFFLFIAVIPSWVVAQFPTYNPNYSLTCFAALWVVTVILVFQKPVKAGVVVAVLGFMTINQAWFVSTRILGVPRRDPLVSLMFLKGFPYLMDFHSPAINPGLHLYKRIREVLPVSLDEPVEVTLVHRRMASFDWISPNIYDFASAEEKVPLKFARVDDWLLREGCKDCERGYFNTSKYVIIEDGDRNQTDIDTLLKHEKKCDLKRIGKINSIAVSDRIWTGYQVFERSCHKRH